MSQATADIIDLLAGIEPGSELGRLRDQRSQARENAQRSFEALLEPAEAGSFAEGERYAVATFVALLHSFDAAAEFYGDLLADHSPELVSPIADAAAEAAASGPYGAYREPGLRSESTDGPVWTASGPLTDALGSRLAAALTHAHLLVFRPRESSSDALRALVAAGWSADDIVSLSQLIAFLSFQLRAAWGLRVLKATPLSASQATPLSASPADVTEGEAR